MGLARIVATHVGLLVLLAGCVSMGEPLAGGRYVAMGSSFAAGPGITTSADGPENRCGRSADNYAHQLARKRNLVLVDVSCGGATTGHILGPWNELPAQIEALTADTALVTVTIGGNDVGYIGSLMAGSCANSSTPRDPAVAATCDAMRARGGGLGPGGQVSPTEGAWRSLADGLDAIVRDVRRRAPRARLVFVDYPAVVPSDASCARVPLSPEAAASARAMAERLAQVTAEAARRGGAELVSLANLSRGHDACAVEPWVTGFVPAIAPASGERRFSPYHPNLRGMTAAAEALNKVLSYERDR